MKLKHILATFVLVMVGTVVFSGGSASAASFSVATGNDENTNNSSCALSEAIENINDGATTNADCSPTGAYGTNDTINLPTGTITLIADLAEIENDITIVGQGKTTSIVDGNGSHDGFFVLVQTANFTAESFTFQDTDSAALTACSTNVTINQVVVANATNGARIGCGSNDNFTNVVTITDSDFGGNINTDNGGFSGLYLLTRSDDGCTTPDIDINLTRVRANNNEAEGAAGVVIASDNRCDAPYTETISLQDVETNSNASFGHAGLTIAFGEAVGTASVNLNRVTANDNVLDGQLTAIMSLNASAGITITNPRSLTATNLTISNNSAIADAGSTSGTSGIVIFAYGAEPDQLSLTNSTVTGNSLTGASNLAGALPIAGIFALGTADLSSFVPATLTNTLAANNTIDGSVSTCSDSVDFGGGPVSVPMTSGGGNVIEDNTCAYALDGATDQNNVSGLFATLAAPAYNDGFVQTIALLEGSPAVDAGVAVPFSLDAQLLSRSQGNAVDAGAYESPFSRASSGGSDGESGGGSTLAESGATVFGIAILSLATLTGAIGVSRRSAVRFRSHL